jgi:hypothetical protein
METRLFERLCATDRSLPSWNRLRLPIALIAMFASLGLTGCGPRRVRADYTHYENSYAVTSNHEELLNLARLDQHDPTYFFKLGQISSSYRMEAALTGTGNLTNVTNPPATAIPTGGGTPNFIYENDPSFTLIPVNDDTNANILLKPVDSTVFYSLYLQGWRLDQLIRLTVSRIELTIPTPNGCKVEVLRNQPPSALDAKSNYAGDGFTIASYITFLRVSAVIYALQKEGLLLLRGTGTFEPLDRASYIPNDKISAEGGGEGGGGQKGTVLPQAKDFNDAATKNNSWELQGADSKYVGGRWVLGADTIVPQFQLTTHGVQTATAAPYAREVDKDGHPVFGQNVKTIADKLVEDFKQPNNGMEELLGATGGEGPDLKEILEIIYNGFAIQESSASQESENKLCSTVTGRNRIEAHLVMRSLIGLMAAAAQEQQGFDALEQKDPSYPLDLNLKDNLSNFISDFFGATHLATTDTPPTAAEAMTEGSLVKPQASFTSLVPKIEQLPILKLTRREGEEPLSFSNELELGKLGLNVKYRGRDYYIADSESSGEKGFPFVSDNQYWNRDMFRLINELSSQVSVDISKFPLPEVLQLRTE